MNDINLTIFLNRFENDSNIDFLFFWSHVNRSQDFINESCLSQWYSAPFIVNGIIYPTSEHWMMASKAILFDDIQSFNDIIKLDDPRHVKEIGRNIKNFDDYIWQSHRFKIVTNGNVHKFNQHSRLLDYLISTNDKVLVEASPYDKVWGIGMSNDNIDIQNPYCWNGLNLLGFALMEVRNFIKKFGQFQNLKIETSLPWLAFPGVEPLDMFWRMGKGEDLLFKFYNFYQSLSAREKTIFALMIVAPLKWNNFLNK